MVFHGPGLSRWISKQQHGGCSKMPGSSQRPPSTRREFGDVGMMVSMLYQKGHPFGAIHKFIRNWIFHFWISMVHRKRQTIHLVQSIGGWEDPRFSWLACRYWITTDQYVSLLWLAGNKTTPSCWWLDWTFLSNQSVNMGSTHSSSMKQCLLFLDSPWRSFKNILCPKCNAPIWRRSNVAGTWLQPLKQSLQATDG